MTDLPPSLPESAPASPVPDSIADPNNGQEQASFAHLPAEHRDVVRRLYQQVKAAIDTIEDLRAENERLRQRIDELEAGPEVPDDETLLTLDDDPEQVRERITQFIDTIDTYLDTAASPNAVGEDADT